MISLSSKRQPTRQSLIVGCALLLAAAGAAALLRVNLAKVSASAPPAALLAGPTCNVISGFVYQDLNNNGLKGGGEAGISGSTLELRRLPANTVVATAVTDANGFYQFSADATISTAPQTITYTRTFPTQTTNWMNSMTVPQFDPALGMLTSVKINNAATITGTIRVENTSTTSTDVISATVGGNVTVSAPAVPTLTSTILQPHPDSPFNAAIFDNNLDFGGTSGKSFSPATASGNSMTTLVNAADLNLYTGAGNVTINASAVGTSSASGGGNLVASIMTTASAVVTVTYEYMPSNCLAAGNYRIVQTAQPAGFADGCETAGNVTKIPGSDLTDFINVTLAGADLPNNNFGELLAADLQITKTDNQTTTTPGAPLTYQIVVRNNGPNPVTNATVTDTFPASLTNVTWSCVGAGGGNCDQPNGAGNINTTVDLPVNATATFTVNATVSVSATGTIKNIANVATPPGIADTNTPNNMAMDTTDVVRDTDLAITKTDGLTTTTLGSLIQYAIVVTNHGPTAVTAAPVTDAFPANLSDVSWTCSATAGSSCGAPNGVGNINTTVDLLVNGKATFIVDAKVSIELPNPISNTATVAVPPGVTDTNPGNNSATDTTLVSPGECPQAGLPTAGAPTTVLGFAPNTLFLLPTDLRFALIAPPAGNASFFAVNDATPGGNPGFPGETSLGLSAAAPNATTRMVSCLDSFRELEIVLAAGGATQGDVVRALLQNPDGTGQTVLATFTFQGGVFVATQIGAGVSLSIAGVPVALNAPIPPALMLGTSQSTAPITVTLAQPALASCFQLAVDIMRAGLVGTTSAVLTEVRVNRNTVAGDAARGFPTGTVCAASCPTDCPPTVCDERICFRPPEYYCSRGIPYSVKTVRIPQINFGNPVYVRVGASVSTVVSRYLGCGFYAFESNASPSRVLTKLYLAAQISVASDPQNPDPCKLDLGCFLMMMGGMPSPIPVTLSNGVTINSNTKLADFFKQTEAAILDNRTPENRAADIQALIAIYKALACGD
jgi:uncharacterized repeat protein (TIGR01451 family)